MTSINPTFFHIISPWPLMGSPSTGPARQVCSINGSASQVAVAQKKKCEEIPPNTPSEDCQLAGLIEILGRLSDPERASKEDLFHFSWGLSALPKKKKFSEAWMQCIASAHWSLLEDIARQMTSTPERISEDKIKRFSGDAADLKKMFEIIKNCGKAPDKPCQLWSAEILFYPDFNKYILEQMERYITAIRNSLGSSTLEWLKDPTHVKALFRTLEVIGESSKILREDMLRAVPTLKLGDDMKELWGKLRDQLHHNKGRCWDIVNYAPEMFAIIIDKHLVSLQHELDHLKYGSKCFPDGIEERKKEIEELYRKAKQDEFTLVRKGWRELRKCFKYNGAALGPILFGFKKDSTNDFGKIWEDEAKLLLNDDANEAETRDRFLELLRIGAELAISNEKIEELTNSEIHFTTRDEAIVELQRILSLEVTDENIGSIQSEFDKVVDQLVFLKEGTSLKRDQSKSLQLKGLISEKRKQGNPERFDQRTFINETGGLTEYGRLKECHIDLTLNQLQKSVVAIRQELLQIEEGWPNEEITENSLLGLKNECGQSSQKNEESAKDVLVENIEKIIGKNRFKEDLKKLKEYSIDDVRKRVERSLLPPVEKSRKKVKENSRIPEPPPTPAELAVELNTSKQNSLLAIIKLLEFLRDEPPEREKIQGEVNDTLALAFEKYAKINQGEDPVKNEKELIDAFKQLDFKDITTFKAELKNQKISHELDENHCLIKLRDHVIRSVKSRHITDWNEKIQAIASQAQNALSAQFVQRAIKTNCITNNQSGKKFELKTSLGESKPSIRMECVLFDRVRDA